MTKARGQTQHDAQCVIRPAHTSQIRQLCNIFLAQPAFTITPHCLLLLCLNSRNCVQHDRLEKKFVQKRHVLTTQRRLYNTHRLKHEQ